MSHTPHENAADTPKPIIGFAAGTPILTPEGSKPIESIKPGDLIQTQPDNCEGDHEQGDLKDVCI